MTQQRKQLHIALSVLLTLALVLAFALPFAFCQTASAAPPTVPELETWESAYTGTYYNNLNENLTGSAFRTQLAKLITDTHTTNTVYNGSSSLALNNVWPKSDVADVNNPNNGQLKWFYTGTVTSSSNFGSTNGTTNREHVWAKNGGSTFTAQSGPGADAHHLRPTECQLNSERGNMGFDEVPQTTSNIAKQNGSTSYGKGDGLCYKTGSFFYPAKGYRGATARILFYMQVRYGEQFNLDFVDGTTTNNGKSIGKISTLMKWHIEEPPNEDEVYRNKIIAGIQGNRNPFIDHPEYAEMIYCNDGQSYNSTLKNVVAQYGSYLNDNPPPIPDDEPTALSLSVSSLFLKVGESSPKVIVTAVPSGASNSVVWSTENGQVATVYDGVVTAIGTGSTTITATSTVDPSVSASIPVTVSAEQPPELQSLTITPSSLTLMQGDTKQLSVSASPAGADGSVSWSSSNAQVATVGSGGSVTAVGAGTATITATSSANPQIKQSVTVTVTAKDEPPVDEPGTTDAFVAAVEAIAGKDTLADRYTAIKQAIDEYRKLTEAQRAAVEDSVQTLLSAIEQYNGEIATHNEQFASATKLSAQTAAATFSALIAAIAFIVAKFGR